VGNERESAGQGQDIEMACKGLAFLLQNESRANELRLATRTGFPAGREGFTPVIEKLTGDI